MHTENSPAKRVQKKPATERGGRPVPHVYFSIKANGEKVYLVRHPLNPATGRNDFETVGTSLDEAKVKANQVHAVNAPRVTTSTTLAEVFTSWRDTRTDLAARTVEHLEVHYKLHIAATFGQVKVREIDVVQLQRWLNHLKRTDGAGALAEGTRSAIYTSLDRLLTHAVEMGALGTVPKGTWPL
jgi:hypothetical protein